MKKLITLITILSVFFITGCTVKSKTTTVEKVALPKEQTEWLKLTGNSVYKYNVKNLPEDKDTEIDVVYEAYEKGKKIKEERILGMIYDPSIVEGEKNINLAFNITEDKIMCTMEDGNIYTELDIEENISDMSSHTFEGVVDMNTDDNNIYLFHGSNNENMTFRKLGKISKEDREMDLKENELNIFIKLVCK